MAVIVHDDMPIDQALRMSWRESTREGIPEEKKELRYRIKPTTKVHAARRAAKKTKTRRARANRRALNKGGRK
ncbi:30S ribosomal protein S21 [Candidatus Dojkabacteria bacterium]|uniref:30S ribosomal protein S21 n=1 Tax=Candidatus Dojkabacteria bacterium TaxID=2099670 RepID=A0A955I764_9BACT|nr:30S ribosomal protein S21 [Candidatus Dojkabacteria bacterium]